MPRIRDALACEIRAFILHGGHRPVVLGDAGPEQPERDDGQQGEERLEHGTVDPTIRCAAKMCADDVLKYLANGEQ